MGAGYDGVMGGHDEGYEMGEEEGMYDSGFGGPFGSGADGEDAGYPGMPGGGGYDGGGAAVPR